MTVRVNANGEIELIGACGSEDAEPLLQHLTTDPGAVVDLRQCAWAHTAVVQVLLAARAGVKGPASGEFVREWVEPLLRTG